MELVPFGTNGLAVAVKWDWVMDLLDVLSKVFTLLNNSIATVRIATLSASVAGRDGRSPLDSLASRKA